MGKKVMIIDDAAFIRILLKNILVDTECEVVGEASNAIEGIRLFRKLQPDIVTMDIVMPDMGGIDAVKIITEINPHVKVIMCTTLGQKSLILEAIQAGAVGYLLKPFNKDKVIETIEKIIQKMD